MPTRGLGRDQVHDAAWGESYPHPFVSCLMPISGLLAMAAIVLIGLHLWQVSLPNDTIIPVVEGVKLEEAVSSLTRDGLVADVASERPRSETVPTGAVITQEPAAGQQVKVGRRVRLVVSGGTAYTTVPDVRELTEGAARQRLQDAELVIAAEEYAYHPSIPFERVISILPTPGSKVERLSTVSLKLSKGEEPAPEEEATREATQPRSPLRSIVVTVYLPTGAPDDAEARIDVTDETGKRTAYRQRRAPGDALVETVQGRGRMTIEVFYANQKVLTKVY